MVARRPQGPTRPWQQGNKSYALIFLVTVLLLVALYTWNKQRIEGEKRDEQARDQLCEVRRETGAKLGDCPD